MKLMTFHEMTIGLQGGPKKYGTIRNNY